MKVNKTEKIDVFVTSVKQIDNLFMISGVTSKGRVLVNSHKKFKPGEFIQFQGTINEADEIREINAIHADILENKKAKQEINDYIESNIKINKTTPFFSDEITKKLSDGFDEAAKRIVKAIFLHRPILIRHHNDTDGICCGLAMYLSIGNIKNVKIIINNYPAYRMIEAQQDMELIHQLDTEYLPPLLMVSDLGSSMDSFDSYDYIKKASFEIIVTDHHPPSPDLEKHVDLIVSPYFVGGSSAYTAGFLTSEISQRIAKINFHDLPFIALVGDKSTLEFNRKDSYLRYAIALGYLVSIKNPTIEEIARNFFDKEAIEMNYMQAIERIEVVKQNLLRKVKTKKINHVSIFLISTDKEFEQGKFPDRGMMANIISDELALRLKTPAITIGYGKRNINMRFNRAALDSGWNGGELVKIMREELSNALESGGGHPGAASIRINKGFAKITLEQLLKEIEKEANDYTDK